MVLEVSDLSAGFGDKALIEHFDITLSEGELVTVHGPSGCGKTTLLRSICGLIPALHGEIRLGGAAPVEWSWPVFRRRMPLMEQQPTLLDGTVEANLLRPFRYRSADGKAFDHNKAAALLDAVGLPAGVLKEDGQQLSAGQQQRVALVRALLLEPAVLLLDEPTSALDEDSAAWVEQLVSSMARETGLAALIVSHQRGRAAAWTHRETALDAYRPADS